MPVPDPEAPEQSLGDCAICMDAILVDPSLLPRSKSLDEKGGWNVQAGATGTPAGKRKSRGMGGLLGVMQKGVGSATVRKNYSLAPCHHLFVSALYR